MDRGYQLFAQLIPHITFTVYGRPLYNPLFFLYILFNILTDLMTPEAEKFNGWMAMIGFIAAVGAYTTTGQIIPGIF